MNTVIRNARQEDLQAVLDLYVMLHPENAILPEDKQIERVWQQIQSDPKMNCFVAETENKIVGTCILAVIPNLTRNARSSGIIDNVVVHSDYQRYGIGTQLMRHVLKTAWDQNCYKVMLLSGTERKKAHRFYEKLGFNGNSKVGFVATSD